LEQFDQEIHVTDGTWSYVAFRVNEDDQLVFARLSSIEDDQVLTDENGRIVEVKEFEE
jgi:hypothetical protein